MAIRSKISSAKQNSLLTMLQAKKHIVFIAKNFGDRVFSLAVKPALNIATIANNTAVNNTCTQLSLMWFAIKIVTQRLVFPNFA